jgi:hypothetical protein
VDEHGLQVASSPFEVPPEGDGYPISSQFRGRRRPARLRAVRALKAQALQSIGAEASVLVAPSEYRDVTPMFDPDGNRSAKATALLARWRPALLGYAGVFADLLVQELLDTVDRSNDVSQFQLASGTGDLRWPNTLRLRNLLVAAQHRASARVFTETSIAERGMGTAFEHLEQLLALFRHLDVVRSDDGRAVRQPRYAGVATFVNSGLSTAITLMTKTDHLIDVLAPPGTTAQECEAIARRSTFLADLALLRVDQLAAANAALTIGNHLRGSNERSADLPFDPEAFHLRGTARGPVLGLAIALDELVAPTTLGTSARLPPYDFDAPLVRTVGTLNDSAGAAPDAIGCPALLPGRDGSSGIAALRRAASELRTRLGVRDAHLHMQIPSHPAGGTALVITRPSVAKLQYDQRGRVRHDATPPIPCLPPVRIRPPH